MPTAVLSRVILLCIAIVVGVRYAEGATNGKRRGMSSQALVGTQSVKESSSDVVKVKGKGSGSTKQKALKDAYRDAIERAVGLYVDAEQMISNDTIIKDRILTHSNAYIEKYSVISQNYDSGLVSVEILAEVRKLALTKKMSEVLPASALNIKEENRNLHARIVTQDKRNADSAEMLKKTLEGINPITDLLSMSLASITPMRTYVDGNDSVVRLSYQLEVKVDENAYRTSFVRQLEKVLRQISLEMPKPIRLERDIELSKQADINKKNRPSRPNSGDAAAPRRRRYEPDGYLHRDGVSALEQFDDVFVVKGHIANSDYVFTGLGTFWLRGFRYSSFASHSGKDVRALRYGFTEVSSGHRVRLLNGKMVVLLASNVDAACLNGKLFWVDPASFTDVFDWQNRYVDIGAEGYSALSQNRITRISVRFKDEDGRVVVEKILEVANQDIIITCCVCLEDSNDVLTSEDGRKPATYMWYVTPLVSGIAKSYKKWFSIDVNKDDVGRIVSVDFEIQD